MKNMDWLTYILRLYRLDNGYIGLTTTNNIYDYYIYGVIYLEY